MPLTLFVPTRWTTAVKDVTSSTVFKEFPRTLRHFRYTYSIMLFLIVTIIVLSSQLTPQEWRIHDKAFILCP